MPELPEVETVCRGLDQAMTSRKIISVDQNRPNLRFPFPKNFPGRLAGRKIERVTRRAKYILVELDAGLTLLMHLGMSGRFEILTDDKSHKPGSFHQKIAAGQKGVNGFGKHAHVVFYLDEGTKIVYSDPRRFGFMDLVKTKERDSHPNLKVLGVEPLGNEMNADYIREHFRGKQTSLKAILLNQKIIAGIGNIYACEALFRAGLSPARKAASLALKSTKAKERAENLAIEIRSVLTDAIQAGGSSLRDFANVEGDLGYFQHTFQAYDQEGEACKRPGCYGVIKRIVQNNRSTFFCPSCQK